MQKHIEIIERMMFAMANHTVDGKRIFPTLKVAKEALEKQIPKKPIIKYGDDTITHNLGRLMCFHCPNCGRYIVALYETDVANGAGIHNDLKGCPTCLQAVDLTGYYHIHKLDEKIELE